MNPTYTKMIEQTERRFANLLGYRVKVMITRSNEQIENRSGRAMRII